MIPNSFNNFNMSQTQQPLAPNLIQNSALPPKAPIGLTQFRDLDMPQNFVDNSGISWKLAKSAKDSSVEIPDPSMVALTRWWNHVHPASNGRVYLYVVEGIKKPRIETEAPVMVLYQWFSMCNRPNFTPQDITSSEWYNANVYTANIVDSRISILNSLCGSESVQEKPRQETIQELDVGLLNEPAAERKARKPN